MANKVPNSKRHTDDRSRNRTKALDGIAERPDNTGAVKIKLKNVERKLDSKENPVKLHEEM